MGIIIAKFRKKKSTEDVLEALDKEIKSIETFRRSTEQAQKKIVGRFLLISVIVYLGSAFLFYFCFFPATFYDRLFYIIPLILAPVIIISTKKGLTWYYNRKIIKKQLKLENLQEEKKKILDKVMETETYKVAKIILEKYAPEQIRKNNYSVPLDLSLVKPSVSNSSEIPPPTGLRQRTVGVTNQPSRLSFGGFQATPKAALPMPPATVARSSILPAGVAQVSHTTGLPSLPLPLPRAILPRERSVLDKMVEYLIGDGPSNRYALICKQCSYHNGMALKEEFEYLSFRCCYCYTLNPAHKKRQFAPRLEITNKPLPIQGASDTSGSEKNSPSDSDSEIDKGKLKRAEISTLYTSERVPSDAEKSDVETLSSDEVKSPSAEPVDVDSEFEKIEAKDEEIAETVIDETETKITPQKLTDDNKD